MRKPKLTAVQQEAMNGVLADLINTNNPLWKEALLHGADVNTGDGLALKHAIALKDDSEALIWLFTKFKKLDVNINDGAAFSTALSNGTPGTIAVVLENPKTSKPLFLNRLIQNYKRENSPHGDLLASVLKQEGFVVPAEDQQALLEKAILKKDNRVIHSLFLSQDFDKEALDTAAIFRCILESDNSETLATIIHYMRREPFNTIENLNLAIKNYETKFKQDEFFSRLLDVFGGTLIEQAKDDIISAIVGQADDKAVRASLGFPHITFRDFLEKALQKHAGEFLKTMIKMPEIDGVGKDDLRDMALKSYLGANGWANAIALLSIPGVTLENIDQTDLICHVLKDGGWGMKDFAAIDGFGQGPIDLREVGKYLSEITSNPSRKNTMQILTTLPDSDPSALILGAIENFGVEYEENGFRGTRTDENKETNENVFNLIKPFLSPGFDFRKAAQIADVKTKAGRMSLKFMNVAARQNYQTAGDAALGGTRAFAAFINASNEPS